MTTSDFETVVLDLEPGDIDIIMEVYDIGRHYNVTSSAPKWVKPNLLSLAKKLQDIDNKLSAQNNLGEAQYEVSLDESAALAFMFVRVLKKAHEHQRRIMNKPADMYALRAIFALADKLKDQHLDKLSESW